MESKRNIFRGCIGFILVITMLVFILAGCENSSTLNEQENSKDTDEVLQMDEDEIDNQNNNEQENNAEKNSEEGKEKLTFTDGLGNQVEITKNPERTIVVYNSMLDIWYLAGGTAIGRPDSKDMVNVPPEAVDIEIVGQVTQPNTEKILSLEPDLVILSTSMSKHKALKEILDQNGIENLILSYQTYRDFEEILDIFSQINGDKKVIEEVIPGIKRQVQDIVDRCPKENGPKVLILLASTSSVKCETTATHTGYMVDMLGGINIVGDPQADGQTRVQFSMEKVIQEDPDMIFIIPMGSNTEAVDERIKKDLTSNEAWAGLRAVKEGNVHYLPSEFFLKKPNTRYPEAFEYLAKLLYPEVFGE